MEIMTSRKTNKILLVLILFLILHTYRKRISRLLFPPESELKTSLVYRNKYENVIVTMSSSPTRLHNLINVLHNIWPIVKEVHLNLPLKFRNQDTYDLDLINLLKSQISNLKVFWFLDDIGPIMKSLPTFQRSLNNIDWIVSLDDDVIYESNIITDLQYLERNQVYCGTVNIEKFDDGSNMSLLYGVSGIAWPTVLVPKLMPEIQKLSNQTGCKYHDDYVHSIILNFFKIKIQERPWTSLKQRNIQFTDDALLWMNRGRQTQDCVTYASEHYQLGLRTQSFKDRVLSLFIWDW